MNEKLQLFEKYLGEGLSTENMIRSLSLIGCPSYDEKTIENMRIYSDYLPMMEEDPYTQEQRYMHILWEAIDQVPLGIDCGFSIPFRSMIAHKLFKKCGKGFIASPHCTFNFGHRIAVGDNVAWNSGCYIDSKGTVTFGSNVMLAENVSIFSHNHSKVNHMERVYKPVVIEDNAMLSGYCKILSGVRIGEGAMVALGAVVRSDVPANTMVAGVPATVKGEVDRGGLSAGETNHFFFAHKAFQED